MREFLLRGFDYDLWANQKWINQLGTFRNGQRALEIFEHIIDAQRIWLMRCGVLVEQVENIALGHLVGSFNSTWKVEVEERDLSAWIEYQSFAGEDFTSQFGDIAAHVINHGTYHRGQLRGLAEKDGIEFPDTDLIHYIRTQ